MKTLSAPLSLCFGITNKCNLNCRHCLAVSSRGSEDLTTEELLDVIRQIRELKILNVSVFGGEPLMRRDFFTIIEELSRFRIGLSLNTNATLITGDIAKRLAGYPIKSYTVSLDGSSREVQDPFRGKGSFEKNIKGIKNLIKEGHKVLISTIVTRFNHKDVENIVMLGKEIGAYQVRFNEVVYTGNAACFHDSLLMSVREKFELLERLKGLKERFAGFVTGSMMQIIDIMENIKRNPREKFPLKVSPCGAATKKCAIRPDGWVVPCEILWDVKAGNVKESSLYDIWHNSPVMKAFRDTIEIKEEEIPECKGCEYLRLCYKGHRCQPYYYPGEKFQHKELYCWKEEVAVSK